MEEIFYSDDNMIALLEVNSGEKLEYIGLSKSDKGTLLATRAIYKNSMKFLETYGYNDNNDFVMLSSTPVHAQASFQDYLNSFESYIWG